MVPAHHREISSNLSSGNLQLAEMVCKDLQKGHFMRHSLDVFSTIQDRLANWGPLACLAYLAYLILPTGFLWILTL